MSMPNIDDIIPEGPIRKQVYLVGSIAGGLLFLTQIGFAAAGVGLPVWLVVANAVFQVYATAGFAKARANTPSVPVAPIPVAPLSTYEPESNPDTGDGR